VLPFTVGARIVTMGSACQDERSAFLEFTGQ
jgi:hypothetical protein